MKFDGKNVLVTGSDQGIGQAIAIRFAEEGANVAINYRKNRQGADETHNRIAGMGRRSTIVQADLSQAGEAFRLVEESIKGLGSIEILVNNAGVEKHAPFLEINEADYRTIVDIDMSGPFFVTQAFALHRQKVAGPGKVINISSVHEELPFPNFTPYCMAKGGLKMMMRNLAIELAPMGITVNNIAPGAIRTPINEKLLSDPNLLEPLLENIPLSRLGEPSDVAGAVIFLASQDADYITGATIVVDGGLTWNYSEQ